MSDFSHILGDIVKRARSDNEYSQVALADALNIDRRTLLKIENYTANPRLDVLYPLIRTLNIDPHDIFYPELNKQSVSVQKIQQIVSQCSEDEAQLLIPIIMAALESIKKAKNK